METARDIFRDLIALIALCCVFPVAAIAAEAKINLADSDKNAPVLYNIYTRGMFSGLNSNVNYLQHLSPPDKGSEYINILSAPVTVDGLAGTRFTVYSVTRDEGIRIEWMLPGDEDFEETSGESVSRVLMGLLRTRHSGAQDELLDLSTDTGDARLFSVSYSENETGSHISGYTIRVDTVSGSRPKFWRALGEVVALNAIGEAEYYYNLDNNSDDWKYRPTWNGVRKKIADGPELDANNFTTNAVGHLYSGNLYYTAARSNGYGFFPSMLFAVSGSIMWEYLGEFKEQVSANDIVFTGIGGSLLGEGLTQTSIYIEKNFRRSFLRDAAVLLLNPLRVLNRFIDTASNNSYTINLMFINPAQAAMETMARR